MATITPSHRRSSHATSPIHLSVVWMFDASIRSARRYRQSSRVFDRFDAGRLF